MENLVEEVAKVLFEHPGEDGWDNGKWEDAPEHWKPHWRSLARAAIAVMEKHLEPRFKALEASKDELEQRLDTIQKLRDEEQRIEDAFLRGFNP